jgi:hypothetical protein
MALISWCHGKGLLLDNCHHTSILFIQEGIAQVLEVNADASGSPRLSDVYVCVCFSFLWALQSVFQGSTTCAIFLLPLTWRAMLPFKQSIWFNCNLLQVVSTGDIKQKFLEIGMFVIATL